MTHAPRLGAESLAGRRPYQEDALLARPLPDGRVLVAVADGMGGHAAGEVASAVALEALEEAVTAGKELDEAFRLANARIHERAREPGKQGMGTTLVALLLEGGRYRVANVGDSRCYLLSERGVRRLTEDHSFVAEAVRRGQPEEQAMRSQWKDALTRSMGTGAEVEVDVFGPFEVEEDSALVLCSDGLYKTLPDDDLLDLFLGSEGPEDAARGLAAAALARGSDDNVSVVVAELGRVPRGGSAVTRPLDLEAAREAVERETPGDRDPGTEPETKSGTEPGTEPGKAPAREPGLPGWVVLTGIAAALLLAAAVLLLGR